MSFLLLSSALLAQERTVDPTWLHRYVPELHEVQTHLTTETCHYTAIFGEGDADKGTLLSVTRFGEAMVDAHGSCQTSDYDREEELYFVLEGNGLLHAGNRSYALRANDFTYLSPGLTHTLENRSEAPLRVVVMGFKIPRNMSMSPSPGPKIVNLDDVREEPVEGHPTSVLYKLLAGPRTGTRDAIDQAYVMTSLFWMDFAPGGTNFPHHHEIAEEIYLVIDGTGEMVAGGGMNGIEGRHPAKAGDAYYFRPNCTVGFYNEKNPGAKAHVLAVRSIVPVPRSED
jgi:mannose-6-phosphate isomerase-like protein (cupin superfamily)